MSKPLPGGIPEVCHDTLQRMVTEGYIQELPDQLTVNQYNPGQGKVFAPETPATEHNEQIYKSIMLVTCFIACVCVFFHRYTTSHRYSFCF